MRTVARFDFPEYAHLARTLLADNEIEAFVFDENLIQLNWLYCYAIGGVRLVVDPGDHADAVRILKSCARTTTEDGYETFSLPAGHLFAVIISLAISVPCFLFGRRTYYVDPRTRKIRSQRPD